MPDTHEPQSGITIPAHEQTGAGVREKGECGTDVPGGRQGGVRGELAGAERPLRLRAAMLPIEISQEDCRHVRRERIRRTTRAAQAAKTRPMKRIGAPGIIGNSIPAKPINAKMAPNTERIIDSNIVVLTDQRSGKEPPAKSSIASFSADI